MALTVLVDVANVMGSTPDGWWRDRLGAANRLLTRLATLPGTAVAPPGGSPHPDDDAPGAVVGRVLVVGRVVAVVEGQARRASAPAGVDLRVAPASGDDEIVLVAGELTGETVIGGGVVVVTADRGLRARLPAGAQPAGPRWLIGLLPPSA